MTNSKKKWRQPLFAGSKCLSVYRNGLLAGDTICMHEYVRAMLVTPFVSSPCCNPSKAIASLQSPSYAMGSDELTVNRPCCAYPFTMKWDSYSHGQYHIKQSSLKTNVCLGRCRGIIHPFSRDEMYQVVSWHVQKDFQHSSRTASAEKTAKHLGRRSEFWVHGEERLSNGKKSRQRPRGYGLILQSSSLAWTWMLRSLIRELDGTSLHLCNGNSESALSGLPVFYDACVSLIVGHGRSFRSSIAYYASFQKVALTTRRSFSWCRSNDLFRHGWKDFLWSQMDWEGCRPSTDEEAGGTYNAVYGARDWTYD